MPVNVVTVLGSSRLHGNSSKALSAAVDSMQGASIKSVKLGLLRNLKPCVGCDSCKTKNLYSCVINDDMQQVIRSVREADAVLIAFPIYCFSYNSLTKTFIDRVFYSLLGNDRETNLLKGKRFGLIVTFGDDDEYKSGAINAINAFKDQASFFDIVLSGIVFGKTLDADGPSDEMLDECRALGAELIET